jgi:aminoacyl tRNA synthase complex-interacting multifunctional protein 1
MIEKLETNVGSTTIPKECSKTETSCKKEVVVCEKKTKCEESKTCSKAPEKKAESNGDTKDTPPPTDPKSEQPKPKKKKQKKKKPKKKKPRAPSLWEQLDFRVGNIVECTEHPESDKLYIEKIDVGEEEPRQILSGLQKVIPKDQMTGNVIVWVNLKPKKLGGIPSCGMVMCAQTKDKSQVVMMKPCPEAKVGDKVYLEGMEEYILSEMEDPPKDEEGNVLPTGFKLEDFLALKTKNMNNSKRLKKVGALLLTDAEGNNCFGKFKMRTKDGLLENSKIPNGIIQ